MANDPMEAAARALSDRAAARAYLDPEAYWHNHCARLREEAAAALRAAGLLTAQAESGCGGRSWHDLAQDRYRARLELLVQCAAQDGYTVTVEQRPLEPLAMGRTETVVTVRESHASYRSR